MKLILPLCLLLLISLANAQTAQTINTFDTKNQHQHYVEKTMNMSMNENMDCCSEGVHINCSSIVAINISTIFSQKTINDINLSTSIFEVSFTSFVATIPTPPPTV